MAYAIRAVSVCLHVFIRRPQYSPMLNPIENGFKSVNDFLRKHFQRIDASNDDGLMVLQEAFASVGGELGRAYFRKMHNELDMIP